LSNGLDDKTLYSGPIFDRAEHKTMLTHASLLLHRLEKQIKRDLDYAEYPKNTPALLYGANIPCKVILWTWRAALLAKDSNPRLLQCDRWASRGKGEKSCPLRLFCAKM